MKKIIVFGATGGTGRQVVEQALQAGHLVTIVVRNPEGFPIVNPKLEIIKGDVLQSLTFQNALNEKDAVISCLGSKAGKPTTVYSEGVSNITAAMRKAGVKRIMAISAGAVIVPPKASVFIKFLTKNILQRIFKDMYVDMLAMEKLLAESGLDWTVVRPPRLTNGKRTGKYRVAINEPLNNPSKISRANLADYIVNHLMDEYTFKAIAEVGD